MHPGVTRIGSNINKDPNMSKYSIPKRSRVHWENPQMHLWSARSGFHRPITGRLPIIVWTQRIYSIGTGRDLDSEGKVGLQAAGARTSRDPVCKRRGTFCFLIILKVNPVEPANFEGSTELSRSLSLPLYLSYSITGYFEMYKLVGDVDAFTSSCVLPLYALPYHHVYMYVL